MSSKNIRNFSHLTIWWWKFKNSNEYQNSKTQKRKFFSWNIVQIIFWLNFEHWTWLKFQFQQHFFFAQLFQWWAKKMMTLHMYNNSSSTSSIYIFMSHNFFPIFIACWYISRSTLVQWFGKILKLFDLFNDFVYTTHIKYII
jgi:hypothetical protein